VPLSHSSPHIRVVAAVIEQDGRYLITQRRPTAILPGLWEFPSGRVEAGETDQLALRRELRERVGVEVEVGPERARRTHHYDGYAVDLVLYRASLSSGQQPRPLRVADFRWVAPQELEQYPFPPADQESTDLLLGLRFPPRRAEAVATKTTAASDCAVEVEGPDRQPVAERTTAASDCAVEVEGPDRQPAAERTTAASDCAVEVKGPDRRAAAVR
jgi:8-oxo-dGTP diphosphatase